MKYLLILLVCMIGLQGQAQKTTVKYTDTLTLPKLAFDEKGELVITPSATSSSHDFDYLVGKWTLKHTKLRSRLVNCKDWDSFETVVEDFNGLAGLGNFDIGQATFEGKPWEGRTIRIFNPQTRLWSLFWVASDRGVMDPPVVGSFENNIGLFFCKDVYKGKPVIVVFRWDKRNPEVPVWSQAFSDDNGKTWEWNWYNFSYRKE